MSATTTIFKRELKSYFNSPVFYVFCFFFLFILSLLVFGLGGFFENRQANLEQLWFFLPILLTIMVPVIGMNIWAEERRSKTIELLFTLPLTKTQAVIGKFLASWVVLALVILFTITIPLTAEYLGNPDRGIIISGYIGAMLLSGAFLSICSFASALTKSPVVAMVVGVAICAVLLFIGFGTIPSSIEAGLGKTAAGMITGISFWSHTENFSKGAPSLSDFLYFFSIIGVMLFATVQVLKHKAGQ